jgi:isoleucyl-tRNA synthetase
MNKFEELDKRKASEVEKDLVKYWKENKVFEKSIENREGKKDFVFYDGPIYANAKPGIHHVFAKTIKDTFCKYKTMQGYRVLRKIGLDTHGLPIEVNVEKKLGFTGKADIEKFGVENFCKECNKATAINIDEINHVTDMMGQFIDCDNPYITCSNDYIESEWWIIKEMDKKGLLYHGNKVLWYCPRCGTELSANEVSQGYEQVSVNSVIVPFKEVDSDSYFLAWTTTAWTLMANVALCVNPDLTYIKAESQGYKFILAECLANKVLGDEYKVLETYKGSDLVGRKYEQLMPFVKVDGNAFEIIADSYVSAEDGTGIVHNAPAYGDDDNRVCRENNIGFVNPVGLDGRYTEGPWKGTLVTDKDLELEIIKWLKENDRLFKKNKITHDYPHCWRCHSPLISYPKPAWYIKTTAYKDKIIEANKKINWYPSYVGEKRFGNWLENMVDWGISRNRYWGCPLPVWTCSCGHKEVIGSLDELQNSIMEDVNVHEMELHRPYVDELHIKCKECGKTMNRVKDVMDVWFDSGSMPYAQFHYPFENKELFENQFPADFIAEGLDQTRGWFYVLLVISTIISGESSFKNVVVNDMMLDANGKKMSKSTGNIIDPVEIMTKYGADPIRWYMLYTSPVWTPLKFDENGVKEVNSKFISTLKNTYSFFEMYANADGVDPREYTVDYNERDLSDKWLLSKLNKLVREVTASYEEYNLTDVVKNITNFVSEDLSNWYIRGNRRRFWESELTLSKKAVYLTTYETLLTLTKLIAPVVPFISEEIYQKLTGNESVHLENFPVCNEKLINEEIENKMDLVRDICSLGRFAREDAKIKVRQPISELILAHDNKALIETLEGMIKDELNVKNITYMEDLTEYMDYVIKPNFREVGKVFGPKIKLFQEALAKLSTQEIETIKNGTLTINLDGEDIEVNSSMVEINVKIKEGYCSSNNGKTFVILNTELTEELINEGIARELIRKIQSLRKDADLIITDHINVYYNGDDTIDKVIRVHNEFIKGETLALDIIKDESLDLDCDINDIKAGIKIEKN